MSTSQSSAAKDGRSYHHGGLRDGLLRRAVEVISTDGIEALSLRSLARDLGVSHAAPARHFRTKKELLTAIALDGVQKLIAATEAGVRASGDNPISRLKAMAKSYASWAADNPAHHNALRNPEVMRFASKELKDTLVDFASLQIREIDAAKSAGWKNNISTRVIMFQLVAMVVGSSIIISDPIYRAILPDLTDETLIDSTIETFLPSAEDLHIP